MARKTESTVLILLNYSGTYVHEKGAIPVYID